MNGAPDIARYRGCLLGLALGDTLGAPHEGGPLERWLWRWIGRTRDGRLRHTDDTAMALELAASLIERQGLDAEDAARRHAAGYHWSRGYGPGAARVLKSIRAGQPWAEASRRVYPEGSWGNGAAMRAAVIGLYCPRDPERRAALADGAARITHAHPLGREGAGAIAEAVALALADADGDRVLAAVGTRLSPAWQPRLQIARDWLAQDQRPTPREIRKQLGNGIAAVDSVITALYLALAHRRADFDELLASAIDLGGDVDTIAAMAGAIWGAHRGEGSLPARTLGLLEAGETLTATADALWQSAADGSAGSRRYSGA